MTAHASFSLLAAACRILTAVVSQRTCRSSSSICFCRYAVWWRTSRMMATSPSHEMPAAAIEPTAPTRGPFSVICKGSEDYIHT